MRWGRPQHCLCGEVKLKIKTILGAIGTAILVWHLVVWMSITSEFNEAIQAQCAAGQSCTDTINVNPVTDNVTITISSPLKSPSTQELDADFASRFMVGFKLVVEPLTERKLNKASRNYLDVYAMILPYNATLELGEHNETGSKTSSIELLGFQRNTKDAGVHAAAIGFRLKGCEDKGDGFRYCNYVRARDETLSLIFWRDELQSVEYDFGISRYSGFFKELSSKYGSPKTIYVQSDPTTKLSDGWGSVPEGADLSLIERADHTGGVATLSFHGGKFDEYMKTAFPHYERPPDIPSQALPEVKKAEQRLFGERTAEIDRLEVISETRQGTLAVTSHCKAHACPDHYAVWTVDLSTGEAAGALADESEVVVYLGDYGSAEKLPPVLLSEIEHQRQEGLSSPKRVRYVSQIH
jgi:hypothetical protein